jgi:NitT/TauT family transport system substrate-binding protein
MSHARHGRKRARAAAVMTALLLPALGLTAPQVTLGVVNWIGYAPLYVAVANGYYAKYGSAVKLVTFSDNSLMSGALEGGELDSSTLTYDQVIIAAAKGWRLRVVMPLDYSVGGDAIVAGTTVRSLGDLKGHRVAFQPLSPSNFLLSYALAQAGLSERDVRAINSTPEGVVQILATRSADVGVTYQPNVSTLLKLGNGKLFHVLYSSREAKGLITDVLVLKESTLAKNPRLADGLIRGTLDGLAFMQHEPAKAAVIIAKALEVTAADIEQQLPNIENPTLPHLGDVFRRSDALPSFYASGQVIGAILKKEQQITVVPPIETTYDASFVAAIQAHPGDLR